MKSKVTDAELQNLPACVQEYIKLVIKKMRYRKKVRIEVMAELAAHFEDELRDCKTDEEKEQKAQKLIEQFGDAKLLAILLRRAKKRCRPLWRTVLVRAFQAVSVFLIIYLIWFSSGRPAITVDYIAECNKLTRPSADESLNAAPLYQKAVELLEQHLKSSDKILDLMLSKKYEDANSEQKQPVEKWLTDNKEILDLVVAGTKKPYWWQNYKSTCGSDMMGVLAPHLNEYRNLAYSLCWRAQFRAQGNRSEEAFDDIKSCCRFGRNVRKGDKSLVEQLIGIAIEAKSVQTLRSILGEHQIDSAASAQLQKDFEQMITGENFVISFKAEKLCWYDRIQRCFTEGGLGGGHPYPPAFRKMAEIYQGINVKKNWFADYCENLGTAISFLLGLSPGRTETLKSVNGLHDFLDSEFALKTPAQVQTQKAEIDKRVKQLTGRNFLIRLTVPAFEKVFEISSRLKTEVEATTTIIALLRYKQDKGQYPQNLDELKQAGYIKEIPIDPFSDKPLVYKKTDENFILYSVGLNFKDDGGQVGEDYKGKVKLWADEGDAVFWPVKKN